MAQTLKGKGVIWGTAGVTMTGGIVSTATGEQQSNTVSRGSDKGETRDANGEVIAQQFYNAKKVLRVSVVPTGATVAAAISSGITWMPAPAALVTVVDVPGATTQTYNVLSAELSRTNTEAATVDVELERYDANEVATAPIT